MSPTEAAAYPPPPPSAKVSETLDEIVDRYSSALLASAYSLGWRNVDAEDLVQDTLVTHLQKPDAFEGRSALKTYLIGILYHKSREKKRSQVREQPNDPIDEVFEQRFNSQGIWRTRPRGPDDIALSKETAELIDDCLEALTPSQRMAFYLREIEQEPTEDACNILDVSVTHLGVLLFRARNKVRECIEKKWGKRR